MKKLNYILCFCFCLLYLISCKPTPTFYAKAYFSKSVNLGQNDYFVTNQDYNSNKNNLLKKITFDKKFNYYAWKSVKYNRKVNKDESSRTIKSYKTILDNDIKNYKFEETTFINKKGNLLVNYLFFIDDYRCIYLSMDDKRADRTNQNLYIHFDKNYKIQSETKKVYQQLNRGYYTLDGDSIFIDFEKNTKVSYLKRKFSFSKKKKKKGRHFFIKGIIKKDKIEFEKISVPNSPTKLYQDGMNTVYTQFDSILHKESQPIFELVPPTPYDLKYIPKAFQLLLGFSRSRESYKEMHDDLIENHRTWVRRNNPPVTSNSIPNPFYYGVDSIKYINMDSQENPKRAYYYHYLNYDIVSQKKDTIRDCIFESINIVDEYRRAAKFPFQKDFFEKNLIQTW